MTDTLHSLETPRHTRRSARRAEMSLRPLWESYQKAWRAVSDVMDEEDAAMVARPAGTPQGSMKAEKGAKLKRARADKAFEAAADAFATAPTRTVDDAVCRLLFVIDQDNLGDEEERAIRAAIQVLKKS